MQKDGSYKWTAPSTAGTHNITWKPPAALKGAKPITIKMTVVAPTTMTSTGKSDLTFASGSQGAGMLLDLQIGGTDVAFQHIEWLEDPGPASNVSGYFKGKSNLAHRPNPKWIQPGAKNNMRDKAEFSEWPSPWSVGSYSWKIPNRWRMKGKGKGTVFHTETQVMTLKDATGLSTVEKFSKKATRKP